MRGWFDKWLREWRHNPLKALAVGVGAAVLALLLAKLLVAMFFMPAGLLLLLVALWLLWRRLG